MSVAKIVRVYLEPDMLEHAKSGGFGMMNRFQSALGSRGFRVEFRWNSHEERLKSAGRQGYSLFHMEDPFHDRALNLRRSYFYPYWRIENTAKRWEFDVARTQFHPPGVDAATSEAWADQWRRWLFKRDLADVRHNGPIYVPLQGRLLSHRSFQSTSPMSMLRQTLERYPDEKVLAGLHPGENYSEDERCALLDLESEFGRLQLVTGQMTEALKACRFVVTQNSSAALFGYFHHKPAVLFGRVDFHHIAANVHELGIDAAFDAVEIAAPEFDQYLYWFTEVNAIKADEDNAEKRILDRLLNHGWKVE